MLQVNYRASTGYGKAYQNAGNLEWGGKVIQDLVDGKNWVVSRGIADPERVAIMGGSFGGYAALAALAFHPQEFTCGIAINAISDANLFMASMPPYWTTGKARFETRMGKDPEFLKAISPLQQASQVVRPLLIMHNANDVRVKLEHAERMVTALRESGKDVTYLVFPDAGHVGGGRLREFLETLGGHRGLFGQKPWRTRRASRRSGKVGPASKVTLPSYALFSARGDSSSATLTRPDRIVQRLCKLMHNLAQSSLNVIKPSRSVNADLIEP